MMHIALACRSCSKSIAVGNDNTLTAFWTSYLNMAENTLGLLRAVRQGDWLLHLAPIRAIIPLHVSCHTTMPQCHAFPLTTQRCTNSSCNVVSVSSLVARIPSAASLWIKPSRKQSFNRDTRTVGGANGCSLIGLLWRDITSLLSTVVCT